MIEDFAQSPVLFFRPAAAADALAAVFFPFTAAASVAAAAVAAEHLLPAPFFIFKGKVAARAQSFGTRTMEGEREEEDDTGAARRANGK